MARRTYRRRRYRRYFRRYKQVGAQQYFRVKAEFVDAIRFPDDIGQPLFLSKIAQQIAADRSVLTNQNCLTGYTYAIMLSGIFSFYKIAGIRVEVIPDSRNNSLDPANAPRAAYLSYRSGDNAIQTFDQVKANNLSILLDPLQRQVRYWRSSALMAGDYAVTTSSFNGGFTAAAQNNGAFGEQPSWHIRISFYFLYKGSKA